MSAEETDEDDDVLIKSRPAWQSKGIFTFEISIVIVFCTALQRLIEKLDERLMDKHQGKNSRQQKRKRVNSKEFSQCPVPKDAPSWAVKTSVRIDIILCSYAVVCCVAKEGGYGDVYYSEYHISSINTHPWSTIIFKPKI